MARSRSEFHSVVKNAVGAGVTVYFQPKSNITMQYPCIVYERARGETDFANNHPYLRNKRYTLTVIDRDPDSVIPERIAELEMCVHSSFFVSENLNHDVFDVFF